jgi:stage V sporulation protein SpoVS
MDRSVVAITVTADSSFCLVACAVASVLRDGRRAVVTAVGGRAGEQAMRAAAYAWLWLNEEGIDVVCTSLFAPLLEDSGDGVAVKLELRRGPGPGWDSGLRAVSLS